LNDDATIQYGSDFKLTCSFTGTPSLMIKWLFNSLLVDLGDYEVDGQVSVLTVKKFQPSNVGVYQCLVYNQHGSHIQSTTLYGRGKDKFIDCFIRVYY